MLFFADQEVLVLQTGAVFVLKRTKTAPVFLGKQSKQLFSSISTFGRNHYLAAITEMEGFSDHYATHFLCFM